MRKIIIVCGLIAGAIVAGTLLVSVGVCYRTGNFNGNMVLGYASMLLAFSMIFAGVKNYRDKQNNGVVSFGKAFKIGLFISLIASTMYVLVWLVSYYAFFPDFMDKYTAHVLDEARAGGAAASQLKEQEAAMQTYKNMYSTPVGVILLTYMEILPIGLVVSLICALILKRKNGSKQLGTASA